MSNQVLSNSQSRIRSRYVDIKQTTSLSSEEVFYCILIWLDSDQEGRSQMRKPIEQWPALTKSWITQCARMVLFNEGMHRIKSTMTSHGGSLNPTVVLEMQSIKRWASSYLDFSK